MELKVKNKSGRPSKKVYVYDGETGKYLRFFETQKECTDYYGLSKGNLFSGKDYRLMPDGNYICSYRIGRDDLFKQILIDNNKFCKKLPNDYSVEIFNIIGEKIGEFRSARELIELSNIGEVKIKNYIYQKPKEYIKRDRELVIKRK